MLTNHFGCWRATHRALCSREGLECARCFRGAARKGWELSPCWARTGEGGHAVGVAGSGGKDEDVCAKLVAEVRLKCLEARGVARVWLDTDGTHVAPRAANCAAEDSIKFVVDLGVWIEVGFKELSQLYTHIGANVEIEMLALAALDEAVDGSLVGCAHELVGGVELLGWARRECDSGQAVQHNCMHHAERDGLVAGACGMWVVFGCTGALGVGLGGCFGGGKLATGTVR